MVTKKRILVVEAAAREAWGAGMPSMNFPRDLEVRFGFVERDADRYPVYARQELLRLIKSVRWLRRAAAENIKYREHVQRNRERELRAWGIEPSED